MRSRWALFMLAWILKTKAEKSSSKESMSSSPARRGRGGVVMRRKGETVAELYAERVPLYETYADLTVENDGDPAQTAREILARVRNRKEPL